MRKKFKIFKGIGNNAFVQTLAGRLVYLYVLFVYKTSRWTMVNLHDDYVNGDKSFLFAFWHGRALSDMFLMWHHKPRKKVSVLISLHRDGRIIASAMEWLGLETINGSSKRGGAMAALDIIRKLRRPANIVAIAPDGRKPGYVMTDGLVQLASKSRHQVVLSAFSVKRGKMMKTWDRYLLPFPFNKGVLVFSDPIDVPADLDKNGVEQWRADLEKRLIDITREADRLAGLKQTIDFSDKGKGSAK